MVEKKKSLRIFLMLNDLVLSCRLNKHVMAHLIHIAQVYKQKQIIIIEVSITRAKSKHTQNFPDDFFFE